MRARALALVFPLAALTGCASSAKPNAAAPTPGASAPARGRALNATPGPRGRVSWLPTSENGEEGTIEGVPLISVAGVDLLVDGLRIGDVTSVVRQGRPARLEPLFNALRSRREAWLTMHTGESWPGVVAYRFDPETAAAVVKSVVLTSGYAACPSGSFLVETRADGHKRVGRLAVDPLMVTEPDEKVFTVEVKKDAFVVSFRETKSAGPTKVIPRMEASDSSPADLSALAAEVSAMWEAAGLHRSPTDKRFDQAILHVDNAVSYKVLVAVVDAIYAARRSMQIGRHEERVPALNVNLADD